MKKNDGVKGVIKKICRIVLMVILWLAAENVGIATVQAAPASLESSSAVVYGQPSEESNVVGNLIWGSTFDYQGDMTAEDGSVWHKITMVDGVEGYISGDIVFSLEETGNGNEAASEETGEAAAGNEAAAQNETVQPEEAAVENGDVTEIGDSSEEAADTEGENAETDEEDASLGDTEPIYPAENSRQKTYASDVLGAKIKPSDDDTQEAEEITEISEETDSSGGVDKTLLVSVILLFFFTVTGIFFAGKMKREYAYLESNPRSTFGGTARRYGRKNRRRRKSRRKKNKKKKQQVAGKERK